MKKELHNEITNLLILTAKISANQVSFLFNDPAFYKQVNKVSERPTGNELLQSINLQAQSLLYRVVLPLTPTIYELSRRYYDKLENKKRANDEEVSELTKIEAMMFEEETTTEEGLYNKYRLFCFQTLKKLALELLQNTYSSEKVDRIIGKVL